MAKQLSGRVLQFAQGLPEGTTLQAKEFLHLGSRAALGRTLARMARRGKLLRIAHGTYVLPVVSRFGKCPPFAEKTVQEWAKYRGERVVVSRAIAANELGLSTQVPARTMYLTSGRSRRFVFGKRVVELRHAPSWQLTLGETKTGLLIRALDWLGPDFASAGIEKASRILDEKDRQELARAAGGLPEWLAAVICRFVHGTANVAPRELSSEVLKIARSLPEGTPLQAKGLLHLESRAVLNRTLSRLARRGELLRIGRGTYVLPVAGRFGKRPPPAEKTVEEWARHRGEQVVVSCAIAANELGLSMQVPMRTLYLTSGRSRRFVFGKREVELRHAPSWQLALGETKTGLLIRALAWLGPEFASSAIEKARRMLDEKERQELARAAANVPEWLAGTMLRIAHD